MVRFRSQPVPVHRSRRRLADLQNPALRAEGGAVASHAGGVPSFTYVEPLPEHVLATIAADLHRTRRLKLQELIGTGGTGSVFVARHISLPVAYAVKIIYYAGRDDRSSFIDTLRVSIAEVSRMKHPGVIRIHDAGTTDEYSFIVMDLHNPDRNLRNSSLAVRLACSLASLLGILEHTIDAVAFCHSMPSSVGIRGARGVFVHGDIKAENVLLDYRGMPVVTDWLVPNLGASPSGDFLYDGDTRAFGTPMYMPPEQAQRGVVTPASDVWNLGVLIFECLTGFYPFLREQDIYAGKAMSVHRFQPLAPKWIQQVVERCLLAQPEDRFADARQLLEAWQLAKGRLASASVEPRRSPASVRRVFLSSTFGDLIAERDAVRAALHRLGNLECVTMEHRGASPLVPRDECLRQVERSDLMVLLLGHRYGSVDDVSTLSFTELEYQQAKANGIPVLAYRKIPGGSSEQAIDVSNARVLAFLGSLDVTYALFVDHHDLALQVVCDLAKVIPLAA